MAPAPAWVEDTEMPQAADVPREHASSGIHYLLADRQVRVGPEETERYAHWIWKVLSSGGLENASELRMRFDPSYERLEIHHVRLLREGRNVSSFAPRQVKVIHNESELDHRIYDGSLTALVFLEDVRPGDVVDYAFTVKGDNPILKGHFTARLELGFSVPVSRVRHRLVWPADRPLFTKGHGTSLDPTIKEQGNTRVYLWERRDVPALVTEGDTPSWYDPTPWVQLTDFSSWNEVARWAARLFAVPGPVPGALRQLAAPWRARAGDEEKARAAVRLVQDEIRYLGIEIGANSHQPHAPQQVLSQRFGDCKDKALLLTVLLAEVGIEAEPALVSTTTRRGLDEWLPTPFAFDHAIVSARIDGRTVWIDATRSLQGGRVSQLPPPAFERALLVRDDAQGLVPIPLPDVAEATTVVEEAFTLPYAAQPGRLDVHTVYRAKDADGMRDSLDSGSPAERTRKYLNFYAQNDPSVRAVQPPSIEDGRDTGVLTVQEKYELPDFWARGSRQFHAWPIGDEFEDPETSLRASPLEVHHPVHVVYRLRLTPALEAAELPQDVEVADDAFRFTRRAESTPDAVVITYDYRSLRDAVPPGAVRRHLENLDAVRDHIRFVLDRDAALAPPRLGALPTATADGRKALGLIFGLTVVGGAAAALRSLSQRRQKQPGRPGARGVAAFPSGGAPETAVRVSGPDELAEKVQSIRCRCGAVVLDPGQQAAFRYDARTMTVVTRACQGCGASQSVYFDLGHH